MCICQIAVDLFACTSLYTDLVTMGMVSKATGGQVHYLPKFGQDAGQSGGKLYQELIRSAVSA